MKALAAALLATVALSGCALDLFGGGEYATPAPVEDNAYRIGAEDVLDISVWREENLKKEVLVGPDGAIQFPLVGELQATGKTVEQLRDEIAKKLEKYIPDPVVSVAILRPASHRIYVIGRVNKPGELALGRNVNVLQALSLAGGLTPFAAANDIKILREADGASKTFRFRYGDVESGRNLEQNITLRSGDVIVVP